VVAGTVLNIVIGLVTSGLGGGAVWVWQRGKYSREFRRRTRFFGTSPGGTCIIVMNNKHGRPGSTHHHDVQAMIETTILAYELRCKITVKPSDEFRGSNEDSVEFCIGGPAHGSNVRTAGHLAHSLPGVIVHPFSEEMHSLTIEVGNESYRWDRGNDEYALIAKFITPGARRPVILVCGQSALTNRAAVHYLRHSYRRIADSVASVDRFCVIVKVSSIRTYAFQGATFESDVSAAAFRA
jgi:hypothetical protein